MSTSERITARNRSVVYQTWNQKISVSMVTMYLYCPVAAYLRYMKHYTPHPTLKAILGRIVHAAATAFYEAEKQLISSVDTHSTKEVIARQGNDVISKAVLHATKTPLFTGLSYATEPHVSGSHKVELDRAAIAK